MVSCYSLSSTTVYSVCALQIRKTKNNILNCTRNQFILIVPPRQILNHFHFRQNQNTNQVADYNIICFRSSAAKINVYRSNTRQKILLDVDVFTTQQIVDDFPCTLLNRLLAGINHQLRKLWLFVWRR
jgi:hypothetical protein